MEFSHTCDKSEMAAGQDVTLCACLFGTVHLTGETDMTESE